MTAFPASRKKVGRTLLLVLLLAVSSFGTLVPIISAETATDDFYTKTYAWSYKGSEWTLDSSIPKALYAAYQQVPVATRVRNGPAGYGFLTTTEDAFIKDLTEELNTTLASEGYDEFETVSCILAFVQSLPYTSDSSSSAYDEYPRFPIETLVDDGGDCEDTSILFATIMLILGYGTIYINPPEHIAVGVLGDSDLPGTYWTYHEKPYYYCETTGENFEIGELPENLTGQTARLYAIDVGEQYIPNYQYPSSSPSLTTFPTSPSPTITSSTTTSTPTETTPIGTATPTNIPRPLFNMDTATLLAIAALAILVVGIAGFLFAFSNRKRDYPLPQPPAEHYKASAPTPYRNCMYCGSTNPVDAAFCEKCGNKMPQR